MSENEKRVSFGAALEALKSGRRIARSGWNGKDMWLALVPAGNAMFRGLPMSDCVGMRTAGGDMQPGWLASQPDMLSEDWMILED